MHKKENPSVLIIVLNWMNYKDTIVCVSSLQNLQYSNFKICLIDNASINDSFLHLQQAFPDVILIKSRINNGYAGGNKIGVDYALKHEFDLIWILNNDCIVRPESLTELVAAYFRNGNALYSNLTLMSENPDIILYAGTYEIEAGGDMFDKLYGKPLGDYIDTLVEKPARIYGHSILIPIDVIKKYGFMDTRYFLFLEEVDYYFSLYKKGVLSIFVPKAIITHLKTATFKLSPDMKYVGCYYYTRNSILYDKKHRTGGTADILKKKGGFINLIKFFLSRKPKSKDDYYTNLGILHGILGIKGKIIKPEKFL